MCKERTLKNEIIHVLNKTEGGRGNKINRTNDEISVIQSEREWDDAIGSQKKRSIQIEDQLSSDLSMPRLCLAGNITSLLLVYSQLSVIHHQVAPPSYLLLRTESLFLPVLKVDDVFVCCLVFINIFYFLFFEIRNQRGVPRPGVTRSRFFIFDSQKKIEHQTRGRRKINGKQHQEGEIEEQER